MKNQGKLMILRFLNNRGIIYDTQPDFKGLLKKCYQPTEKCGLYSCIVNLEGENLKSV